MFLFLQEVIEVRESPKKFKTAQPKLFKDNDKCRIVDIDSLDNIEVAPLLMNAREDSPDVVSTAVPMGVQQNASFIVDLDFLPNCNDDRSSVEVFQSTRGKPSGKHRKSGNRGRG